MWLLAGQGVIGHDIKVVWEKGYYDPHGDTAFGSSISAGDVNGDGYRDIAVNFAVDTNYGWVSRVYIFLGNPLDTFVDITIWIPQFRGPPEIVVMDINGDGVDDLIAGHPDADKVMGFFGPLRNNQQEDFWMVGGSIDGRIYTSAFGRSLANAGDVNGDGWDDLIVGSPYPWVGGFYGAAYIYYGGPDFKAGYVYPPDRILPGGLLHGVHGLKEQLGMQVGGGGDFNADGYDDVVVSAPLYGNREIYAVGRIYIYFGGNPMDTVEDVVFTGEIYNGWLGENPIDLLNRERGAHAVFGTSWNFPPGKAYVLFGGENYDNIPDIEIIGQTDSSYLTQGGTSSAGDADHDGRDDFILGAPAELHLVGSEWWVGAAYFYRGGNVIDNVFDGWLEGEGIEMSGWRLAEGTDFDSDGRDEFLVSNYAAGDVPKKVWLCKFTGVGIEKEKPEDKGPGLEVSATVAHDAVRFYYDKPLNKEATLSIYNVAGALVRRYTNLTESSVEWDLRDEKGRRVSSGVYTARLDANNGATIKLVVLR